MRIVSFLPAATEIVCALGLEESLVGISHECDYPADIRSRPVVVRCARDTSVMSPAEIDRYVSDTLQNGQSLYEVDAEQLRQLQPDLIITQALCDVCAPSKPQALKALDSLPEAKILYLTPHSLADVWDNIREVGRATERTIQADALIQRCQDRLEKVRKKTAGMRRPKVFCMEWVDPVYNAGHWVAEMVLLAGGRDELASREKDSIRITWEKVVAYAPEVLIVSPCGFNLEKAKKQVALLRGYKAWETLPAVQNDDIYAVDANSYFARPGPRLVEGVEALGHILHPEEADWQILVGAFERLSLSLR